ncbi:MAG: 4-hydroxy-tetrahydrodipicolinate reductase [Bacteroidales bacterium]|nr:4-hydroxy-tetrahydrodipicolinate reductase [Bacteroidales bacterium]
MKVTIIGYGKMGKEIEKILLRAGHEVLATIDNDHEWTERMDKFLQSNVAIEFSTPQTVIGNLNRCFEHHIPVVSGTTGWQDQREAVIARCKAEGGSLVYGSNFSIGANLFFAINSLMAKMMNEQSQYDVSIDETHHITKKDAPSGTAITTAQLLLAELQRKHGWKLGDAAADEIAVRAHRVGDAAGIHTVTYTSDEDRIEITHTANSRLGFAQGAVKAAAWLVKNPGIYEFKDIFGRL